MIEGQIFVNPVQDETAGESRSNRIKFDVDKIFGYCAINDEGARISAN